MVLALTALLTPYIYISLVLYYFMSEIMMSVTITVVWCVVPCSLVPQETVVFKGAIHSQLN